MFVWSKLGTMRQTVVDTPIRVLNKLDSGARAPCREPERRTPVRRGKPASRHLGAQPFAEQEFGVPSRHTGSRPLAEQEFGVPVDGPDEPALRGREMRATLEVK